MKMLTFKTLDNTFVRVVPDIIKSIEHKIDHIIINCGTDSCPVVYKTLKVEQDKEDYKDIIEKRYGKT